MPQVRVGVITCSDTCARGGREDASGAAIVEACEARGWQVLGHVVCADEPDAISAAIVRFADDEGADLVLTTGGTGLGPRDVTPEATRAVCARDVPGIAEAMRAENLKVTGRAMLSRAVAAQRGATLVVNMPGSVKAVRETLAVFVDQVEHGVEMMAGGGHD